MHTDRQREKRGGGRREAPNTCCRVHVGADLFTVVGCLLLVLTETMPGSGTAAERKGLLFDHYRQRNSRLLRKRKKTQLGCGTCWQCTSVCLGPPFWWSKLLCFVVSLVEFPI